MNCDLLIYGCELLTPEITIAHDQAVAVIGRDIAEIGNTGDMLEKYTAAQMIDGHNKLLMPGLIDAHTHACQHLLRGKTIDEYPMIWTRFLVPFESNLTPEDVYWSTKLACVEMIKNGTTAFADAGGVHMEMVAEAVLEAGMRAAICKSTMDTGDIVSGLMKESAEDNIAHTEELYRNYQGKGDGRLDIWFGIRQIMTCSPKLLGMVGERAGALHTGIHMHLCEHKDEISFCLQNYKKRPVEILKDYGVLGDNLLAAHCVALSEHDITLMSENGVKVVHCPRGNMNNYGCPKTPRMLEAGISVGIGTDGAAIGTSNLFDEIKVFRCGINAYWGCTVFDPVVLPCKNLLKLVTQGSAYAIGRANEVGTIEVGKRADMILLNLEQAHIYPTHNLVNTVVVAAEGSDVTDSIINGTVVMRDRELLTLDEAKILAECRKHMDEIAARAGI